MKLIILLGLLSSQVWATSGLSCRGIDNTIVVETTEASSEGDNVLELQLEAPFISKEKIVFTREGAEVSVDRSKKSVVYKAKNKQITLELFKDSMVRSAGEPPVSEIFIRTENDKFRELLVCGIGN